MTYAIAQALPGVRAAPQPVLQHVDLAADVHQHTAEEAEAREIDHRAYPQAYHLVRVHEGK